MAMERTRRAADVWKNIIDGLVSAIMWLPIVIVAAILGLILVVLVGVI